MPQQGTGVSGTISRGGRDAARRAGITYRQLTFWTETGLFVPQNSSDANPGSGNPRYLTDEDVLALEVLGRLMAIRELSPRFGQIAAHVQRHGAHGTLELTRGVTVDLDRLVDQTHAAAS